MKIYELYKNIIQAIKPIEVAWFTTFNLSPELVEKFLLSEIADVSPTNLKTAEDFEGLNDAFKNIDVKVFYDFRALDLNSPKRTVMDFIAVDVSKIYGKKSDAVFHPKVIFLKGRGGSFLISGSANLSFAAYSNNCESVLAKKVTSKQNALSILSFFKQLGAENASCRKWAEGLDNRKENWTFIHSLDPNKILLDHFHEKNDILSVWAPYFSKNSYRLAKTILKSGFSKINIIPSFQENASIAITPKDLKEFSKDTNIGFFKDKIGESEYRFHHAKVWLAKQNLAVGSWNFSYKATGYNTNFHERNVEAGILTTITESDYQRLHKNLSTWMVDINLGISEQEIDTSWKDVLLEYTFSCSIEADWKDFRYKMNSDYPENSGYQVWLPDLQVDKRINIEDVNNRHFFESYRRLLNKRSFKVFDSAGKEIFEGFLIERNPNSRPVDGYSTLNDLMDYLLQNPEKQSGKQKTKYEFEEITEENRNMAAVGYQKPESFYKIFLSMQILYDYIESMKGDNVKLDRIGFRSPGSLTNIIFLIKQLYEIQVESCQNPVKTYIRLYFWFLENEINRCLKIFNQFSEYKIRTIEVHKIDQSIAERNDRKYMNNLMQKFKYESVSPKS